MADQDQGGWEVTGSTPAGQQDDSTAHSDWTVDSVEKAEDKPLTKLSPQNEAAYQQWVDANRLKDRDGAPTNALHTEGMGNTTIPIDEQGNSSMYDTRRMFMNHSHMLDDLSGDTQSPYLDVRPWMMDKYATKQNPKVTSDSMFSKGAPAGSMGSWYTDDDGNRTWLNPGQKPPSVLDKAVDYATKYGNSLVDEAKHPEQMLDEAHDLVQGDIDTAGEALKGLGGAANKAGEAINIGAGALPVIYDTAAQMFTGKDEHKATDWWFKNSVEPLKNNEDAFEVAKSAGFRGEVAHEAGGALMDIAEMVLTGGESTALEASATGMDAAKAALEHGAKATALPATTHAINLGQQVYQETGDANRAVKAAQLQYLITAAGGTIPLEAGGTLPTRMLTGAGSSIATGEAGRVGLNEVLPEDMQTPFSWKGVGSEALFGGLTAGIMGHGPGREPSTPEEPSVDDLLRAYRGGSGPSGTGGEGGAPRLPGPAWGLGDAYNAFHEARNAANRGDTATANDMARRADAEASRAEQAADANPKNDDLAAHARDMRQASDAIDAAVNGAKPKDSSAGAARQSRDTKVKMLTLAARDSGEIAVEAGDDGHVVTVNGEPIAHFQSVDTAEKAASEAKEAVDDRRIDVATRKRVDEMSPQEMRDELLTHALTRIPNRRAYDDSAKLPVQVSVDANSLKYINDTGGHEAGDQLLTAIAKALHDQAPGDAYHFGGDEFVLQAKTPEAAEQHLNAISRRLAGAKIELERPDGSKLTVNGIGISHGTGTSLNEADTNLRAEKSRQESAGLRARRGEQPPNTTITPAGARVPYHGDQAASHPASRFFGRERPESRSVILGQSVEKPAIATEGQAKAGNYRKPEVDFHGLPIKIEHAEGQYRSGQNSRGQKWRTRFKGASYGYFKGTHAADGGGIDVFVGKHPESPHVHVVDQLDPTGKQFDEHKVIVGAKDADEARGIYLRHYPKGWKGLGGITELPIEGFKDWLKSGDHSEPIDPSRVPEPKADRGKGPNARHDSILEYLARHDRGIDSDEAAAQGIDRSDMSLPVAYHGIRRAFRKGGMTFDEAAEALHEQGYPVHDDEGHYSPNVLLDRLSDELRGRKHYSIRNDKAAPKADELARWMKGKSDGELERMSDDDLDALEARLEREAIQAEGRDNTIPFARSEDFKLSSPGGKAGKQEPTYKRGGQQEDLFGDKVELQNQLERVRAAKDAKRNSGQESTETGRPDDLFSQSGKQMEIEGPRAKYRGKDPGSPAQGALDFFAGPALKPMAAKRMEKAAASKSGLKLHEETKFKQVGSFRSGFEHIQDPTQAAHILAPLRRSPQEVMAALVLDHENRPLAVIRHSMGQISSAPVERATLVGSIMDVPGAAAVYFAHNHPSGETRQSVPDMMITQLLHKLLDGTHVQSMGMLVVGRNEGGRNFTWYTQDNPEGDSRPGRIEPAGKTKVTVPEFSRRMGAGKERLELSQPTTNFNGKPAREKVTLQKQSQIEKYLDTIPQKSGLLLLDSMNKLQGILPLTDAEMHRVRSREPGGPAERTFQALHKANAAHVVIFGNNRAAGQNIGAMFRDAGTKVLDIFVGEKGKWKSIYETLGKGGQEPPVAPQWFARGADRDLMVQHNITSENLEHALRMGGMAVPSLAITRRDNHLEGYGPISLIGKHQMADPRGYARTRVFGSDIYSPRYPEVNHHLSRAATDKLNAVLKPFAGKSEWHSGMISDLDNLIHYAPFKAYAASKGITGAGYHPFKELAEKLLREVGADEKIFKGYNNYGDRRYQPHTLDNVVRMLKKDMVGGEGFSYGVAKTRANFTPQFRSVKGIRDARNRLVSKKDFEKVKEDINNASMALGDSLAPYHREGMNFGFLDTTMNMVADAAKLGVRRSLEEYQYKDVPEHVVQEIHQFIGELRTLPTEYFEGKIPRAVQLSEFHGAVVPKGTDPALVAKMKAHGLDVEEYEQENNEEQRGAAINRLLDRNADQVLFRKGAGEPGRVEQVKAAVDQVLKGFKTKPSDVVVAKDIGDLRAKAPGVDVPDDARGFLDPATGKIYLNADAIKGPEDVQRLMAHEYVVHYGLRAMLGDRSNAEYSKILDGVTKAMPSEVRNRGIQAYGDKYNHMNARMRSAAAEEALAYHAERYLSGDSIPQKLKRFADRLIGMVRDWVRSALGMRPKFDMMYVRRVLGDLQTYLRRTRGDFRPEDEAAFAKEEPTFYSAVARAVDASKRGRGTASEWAKELANTKGVKPEELDWINLEGMGDGKFTKDQVADYVHQHRVNVGEVTYSDADGVKSQSTLRGELEDVRTELRQHVREEYPDLGVDFDPQEGGAWLHDKDGDMVYHDETMPGDKKLADLMDRHVKLVDKVYGHNDLPEDNGPQYGAYATPGGKRYSEMLLTLDPTRAQQAAGDLAGLHNARLRELSEQRYQLLNPDGRRGYISTPAEGTARADALREVEHQIKEADEARRAAAAGMQKTDYRSNHWTPHNVLAHVRFDTREENGEKVLHVHEVQSDWHQHGRETGYEPSQRHPDMPLEARREDIYKRWGIWSKDDKFITAIPDSIFSKEIDRTAHGNVPTAEEAIAEARNRLRAQAESGGVTGGLSVEDLAPNAPFKTTWPELVMKRMLRHAAENGYDAVQWDTGLTNANRYNLAEKIKELEVHKVAENRYAINADPRDESRGIFKDFLTKQTLAEHIGHELAEKAIARFEAGDTDKSNVQYDPNLDHPEKFPTVRFTGDDMTVGGHGMRQFYDKILPAKVNALVKKFGTQVRPGKVGTEPHTFGIENDDNGMWHVRDRTTNELVHSEQNFLDRQSALSAASRLAKKAEQIPVHRVDITPDLREAVMGGQPLFARKGEEPPPIPKHLQPKDPDKIRGPYTLARRAVIGTVNSRLLGDIRTLFNPKDISLVSKDVARRTSAFLGDLAQQKTIALHRLEEFSRQIDRMSPDDQLAMIHSIETGQKQATPELQRVADVLRQMLDHWRDQVRGLGEGYLENVIENYFPHFWRDPEDQIAKVFAQIQGRRTMRGPATFLKQRVFATMKEGIEYGLHPVTTNPLIQTLMKVHEMQRFISGVTMMRHYKEAGLAVFLPMHKMVPQGWKEINDPIARVSSYSEAEGGFIQRGRYIMPEDGARIINNHLGVSKLRNVAAVQAFRFYSGLLNAMQLGFSAFHLGFTTMDAVVSKTALAIERMIHGEPLKAAAAFTESMTGPLAAALNVRRGWKLMQAYADPAGATPEMRAMVQSLAQGGGRVHMDRFFQISQGVSPFRGAGIGALAKDIRTAMTAPHDKVLQVSKALGSFPIDYAMKVWNGMRSIWRVYPKFQAPFEMFSRLVRAQSALIMEHLVPMQKLGVFSDMAADWSRRHPNATPEESTAAMQSIWRSVDNRLGEMVYDNKFWDRTFKDATHLTVRAVGWNVGTIEEIGGAPIDLVKAIDKGIMTGKVSADDFGHKIPYVMALTFVSALSGGILNYLMTGEPPKELKDYFFPRTGYFHKDGTAERISLPSYVKDVYEYFHHPIETLMHKANPAFGQIYEQYTGEDYFGNPFFQPGEPAEQEARDRIGHWFAGGVPFSVQGGKQFEGTTQSQEHKGAWASSPFFGITPASGQVTKPEKMEEFDLYQRETKWLKSLQYQLKQANERGDKKGAADIKVKIQQAKEALHQENQRYRREKADAAKAARERAAQGKTSQLMDNVGPLIEQSTSRSDMERRVRAAGYPALAGLLGSLPDKLRPEMQDAIQREAT